MKVFSAITCLYSGYFGLISDVLYGVVGIIVVPILQVPPASAALNPKRHDINVPYSMHSLFISEILRIAGWANDHAWNSNSYCSRNLYSFCKKPNNDVYGYIFS